MTIPYGTDLALDVSYLSNRPVRTYLSDVNEQVAEYWIRDVGPVLSWEKWEISLIHTESNSESESKLWVYRRGRPIQGSYSGNFDTSDSDIVLHPGEKLDFKWLDVSYDDTDPTRFTVQIILDGRRKLQGRLLY